MILNSKEEVSVEYQIYKIEYAKEPESAEDKEYDERYDVFNALCAEQNAQANKQFYNPADNGDYEKDNLNKPALGIKPLVERHFILLDVMRSEGGPQILN